MDEPIVSPQPVVMEQKKSGFRWQVVAGGVIFGIVMLAGGMWLGKMRYAVGITEVKPVVIVSPIPTPVPTNPTANWKTYSSQSLKISFEYPADLKEFSFVDVPIVDFSRADKQVLRVEIPVYTAAGIKTIHTLAVGSRIPKEIISEPSIIDKQETLGERELVYISIIPGDAKQAGYGYSLSVLLKEGNRYAEITVYGKAKDQINMSRSDFEQVVSTFKFTGPATPTAKPVSAKVISYSLPRGWQVAHDPMGVWEVGFDPATSKIDDPSAYGIGLLKLRPDPSLGYASFMRVSLYPYDGGSRRQFIYKYMNSGNAPSKNDLMADYKEVEYLYGGKSCLFLNGITVSQYPTIWGMCDSGNGQAFLITSYDPDYETALRTIRLSK